MSQRRMSHIGVTRNLTIDLSFLAGWILFFITMNSWDQETGVCCMETRTFYQVSLKELGISSYYNDTTCRSKSECSLQCLLNNMTCQHFLYDSVKKCCLRGADLSSSGIKPASGQHLYSQSTKYCDVALGYNSTIMRTFGLCLKIFFSAKDFSLANVSCSTIQGRLVMVKSNAKKESLATIMQDMNMDRAWVGIDDIQSEGTYVWSDGSVLTPEEKTVYLAGQPDDLYNNQDCTVMNKYFRALDDTFCTNNEMYFCEYIN
ncbi:brevican core protein [Biomphalaria glabrata]|nr:brevican core protein [Biomphalaria glabrata]